MRSDALYLLLCSLIVLALYVVVRHTPIQQRDCQQLLANFDRYANTTEWNFGNYKSIPSVWVAGTLVHFERLDPDVVEITLRGAEREGTFVFIVPAYAASRYRLREGYAFDIGNYRRYFYQMVDSRMQSVSYSTEPELVPIRCFSAEAL